MDVADVVRAAAAAIADHVLAVEEARPAALTQAPRISELLWRVPNPPPSSVQEWENFKASMWAFLENHDVILCPPWNTAAPGHGGVQSAFSTAQTFTTPFNNAGWPAAVVRCGTSRDGLPIGVQIASRPWREDIVLAVAQFLETALGGWQPVPPAQIAQSLGQD